MVRKYNARLYRHIQKRLRDPEVAKDLTQETWLKTYCGEDDLVLGFYFTSVHSR